MTDPTTRGPTAPRSKRPGIANADVPSETLGQPGVGEGASAASFARDTVPPQSGDRADPDEEEGGTGQKG